MAGGLIKPTSALLVNLVNLANNNRVHVVVGTLHSCFSLNSY